MKHLLASAALLSLLGAGCSSTVTTTPSSTPPVVTPPITTTSTPVYLDQQEGKKDLIKVTNVANGQLVQSPFTLAGKARGNWYFEASFPVELRDANNLLLFQGPAQAQGNWMTTNFVPFSIVLTFPTPTTATGSLILRKD
nr:Gmad2 immunoglobulin-like domain-containing protein [Patescibacteria group bacterium]